MIHKIKSLLGWSWAAAGLVIVLATFMGNNFWAEGLVKVTGLKVSPWFSGGEIARTVEHNGYRTLVHEPVFDGLIGKRAEGFVRIDWKKTDGGQLPARFEEDLDLNGDGRADCRLALDTTAPAASIVTPPPGFLSLEAAVPIKDGVTVQIKLRRP